MTLAVIPYPAIDPVIFTIGGFEARWYGLAYVAGFLIAALIARRLNRSWHVGFTDDDLLDIVLAGVIGLFVGARVGYVLFYGWSSLLADPLSLFAVWDGGMSFHGGLVGMLLACWFVSKRKQVSFLRLADLGAVGAPVGLFLGRIANFINGELWGRVTDAPWGMVFPGAGPLPRHPSQLYEAFLEGAVIFCVLLYLARRRWADGLMLGTLMALYGVFRIAVEFFREPDVHIGFLLGALTMGQLLSVPALVAGVWLVWRALRAEREPDARARKES